MAGVLLHTHRNFCGCEGGGGSRNPPPRIFFVALLELKMRAFPYRSSCLPSVYTTLATGATAATVVIVQPGSIQKIHIVPQHHNRAGLCFLWSLKEDSTHPPLIYLPTPANSRSPLLQLPFPTRDTSIPCYVARGTLAYLQGDLGPTAQRTGHYVTREDACNGSCVADVMRRPP